MAATEDLKRRVEEWLTKGGYPLEMRVARAFRNTGFTVTQSDYYEDPDEAKAREIDVIATREIAHDLGTVAFTYVIECKSCGDRPWILFAARDVKAHPGLGFMQRFGTDLGRRLLKRLRMEPPFLAQPALALSPHPAYGAVQALKGNEEDAYSTLVKVSKASVAQEQFANRLQYTSNRPVAAIVQPLVVLDGFLFECGLDESTSPTVTDIAQGMLSWRHLISAERGALIQIATLPGLDGFLQESAAAIDLLFSEGRTFSDVLFRDWHANNAPAT